MSDYYQPSISHLKQQAGAAIAVFDPFGKHRSPTYRYEQNKCCTQVTKDLLWLRCKQTSSAIVFVVIISKSFEDFPVISLNLATS